MYINDCKSIEDLIILYKNNKKTFSNNYNNIKNKSFNNKVNNICNNELIKYNNKIGHYFYDYLNPFEKTKKCKMCDNKVLFLNFDKGYSKYCSSTCTVKDSDRISKKSKEIGRVKRIATLNKLKQDKNWFDEYKKKISIKSKYYSNLPEIKLKRSQLLKQKIENGTFTPNITNTWTHWSFEINNKKFRSSFETLFYVYQKEIKNIEIEYEKLRIKYFINNIEKIYIVDFIDVVNNIVYEIKPSSQIENEVNQIKIKYLNEWCIKNNYKSIIIDENILKKYHLEMINKNFDSFIIQYFKKKYKWNI